MFSLIIAAALSGQPAPPAKATEVNVGAVTLRVPLPAGFCLPEGDEIGVAQMLAAADTANITLLTLTGCDAAQTGGQYLLVKAPFSAINMDVSRAELIAELTTPEAISSMEQGASSTHAANERFAELGVNDVSIEASIQMRGSDDVCVYLGGLGTEIVKGKAIPKAMAACMTAIGGRMVSLYRYREGADPEGYLSLMPELRRWALQIEPAR